jgi:hypothetical protein
MKKLVGYLNRDRLKLFVIGNLFLVLVLIVFSHSKPNFKHLSTINNYSKEFTFEPIYNNGFINVSPIEYPHVEIPPFDIRYIYIPFKETMDLKNKKYDELFYANKRVAELLKWGNDIPLKKRSGDEKLQLTDLKDILLTGRLTNSSWEKTLGQYYTLMTVKEHKILTSLKINRQDGLKELMLFVSRLKSHNDDILLTIENGLHKESDKAHLRTLTNDLFAKLNKPIANQLPSFDPAYIYFQLSDAIKEREYGTYDLIIGNISIPHDQYDDIKLSLGDENYVPFSYDPGNKELLYKNIDIVGSDSSQVLFKDPSLTITTKNLAENLLWKTSKNRLIYTADFYDSQAIDKYYMKLRSNFKNTVIYKIEHIYTDQIGNKKLVRQDALVRRSVNLKSGNSSTLEDVLQLKILKNTPTHFRVTLESDAPLTREELESVRLNFSPFYSPAITLRKIPDITKGTFSSKNKSSYFENTYSFKFRSTTQTEEDFIMKELQPDWNIVKDVVSSSSGGYSRATLITYVPLVIGLKIFTWFNALFCFFILLTMFGDKIKKKLFPNVRFFTKSIFQFVKATAIRLKYLIVTVAVLATIVDLFLMRSYSDAVLTAIILLWFFVILGFGINPIILYGINLILFICLPLILVSGGANSGEKLAIYAITSVVISILYLIIRTNAVETRLSKSFLKYIDNLLGGCVSLLNRPVALSTSFTSKLLFKVFNFHPKNRRDHLRNFLALFILLISLVLLSFISNKAYVKIKDNQRIELERMQREALNPNISLVEPRIAYQSTKVLILGRGFGSNSDGSAHLMSAIGEVRTDLWTNEKIVFTIPLDWKPNKISLWIVKNGHWKNESIVVKSDIFDILLIPRSQQFSPDDDAYFQQLRELSDESLIINGYNPKDYE